MREFNLRMLDGKELHCYEWTRVKKPIAVIQMVHGAAEHVYRYARFAEAMNEAGIIVVGDDHRGHGKTANIREHELGYFAAHHGWDKIVDDEKFVNDYIHRTWPTLPVFMVGHSMGSMIGRTYAIRYSRSIQGLILMGVADAPRALAQLAFLIAAIRQAFRGPKSPDRFIWQMAFKPLNGQYNQLPDHNGQEWLTRIKDEQEKFDRDPLTKQIFTSSAFKDMFHGIAFNASDANIKLMRFDLPILILGGTDDAAGAYGKYPQKVYNKFIKLNYPTELKLYQNRRHDLLNDLDYHDIEVDIVNFINQNLE